MGNRTGRRSDCLGGGPAWGLAQLYIYENGITDILILERGKAVRRHLRQCIHDGLDWPVLKLHSVDRNMPRNSLTWQTKRRSVILLMQLFRKFPADKVITAAILMALKQWSGKGSNPGNGVAENVPEEPLAYQESVRLVYIYSRCCTGIYEPL